jgi:adenylate cyclase
MFTDMVGSTALAQADEKAALRLRDEQEELIRPLFAAHQGRAVKSMGDGLLAEFDSALRAIECALDIQHRLYERNGQSDVTPLLLRIGIHLGDVEIRGADILGDSVNIAARIEPLAEPGGICITEPVFGQVRNKISNRFDRVSTPSLKGVSFPVEVYRVRLPWATGENSGTSSSANRIAVLPFASISPDPKDEYVAEGLTEEMISVLSQVSGLRVIARTSVLPYKSTPKSVAQIGSELDVDWVLEGSVRKAERRIRITVQLIEVRTQEHAWSKNYDRELDDVFALQDEIAKEVASSLRVKLPSAEAERLSGRAAPVAEAYLAYLRGRSLLHDRSEAGYLEAKKAFESAVSLDPNFAAAYSGLSDATFMVATRPMVMRRLAERFHEMEEARVRDLQRSKELAQKALSLDPDLAEAHASMGRLLLHEWTEHSGRVEFLERAQQELEKAMALSPSYPDAHTWYAEVLFYLHRTEEGLDHLRIADEADPLSAPAQISLALSLIEIVPGVGGSGGDSGIYYALIGRDAKAQEAARELDALPEGTRGRAQALARIYAYLGDLEQAVPWLEKAIERDEADLNWWKSAPRLERFRDDPRTERLLGATRESGVDGAAN